MKVCISFFILMLALGNSIWATGVSPAHVKKITGDSTIIKHKEDGMTNEWPASKFETDLGTDIRYAVDNDNTNLYIAMNIVNEGIQTKILRMGMNLYIDLKGKKKEGRGITFPIKEDTKPGETEENKKDEPAEKVSPQKKLLEKRLLRSTMALHLVYMKIFGFEGTPSQDQGLTMPGSVNVAFTWDSLDILHIEYLVPLKLLGDAASLKQKEISIGWKLNGMYPSDNPRYYSEQTKAGKADRQRLGADNKPIIERETIVREQHIWKKFVLMNDE